MTEITLRIALSDEVAALGRDVLNELRDIRLTLSRIGWNAAARDGATPSRERPPPVCVVPGSTAARWTPERDALLRQMRADGISLSQILQAVNALPGEPVGSLQYLSRHALEIGCAPLPRIGTPAYKTAPRMTVPSRESSLFSPERDDALRAGYRKIAPVEILAQLNALPGVPIKWRQALDRAAHLGLSVPRAAEPKAPVIAPEPANGIPTPSAGPPAAPPAPAPALPPAPTLPEPAPNGRIYAPRPIIAAWAAHHGLRFDGDMLAVQRLRQRLGGPEIVCVEG